MRNRIFRAIIFLYWVIIVSPILADESAILGGIGTGKIGIGPDGRFTGITINHNPHQPINDPAGCFAAIAVDSGAGSIVKRLFSDSGQSDTIQTVRVTARYPQANVEYVDPDLPVRVHLDAYSPVIPGDIENSCYPAIVFRYSVHNPGPKEAAVKLAMSWRNLIGQGGTATGKFDIPGEMRHQNYRADDDRGILFQLNTPVKTGVEMNALGEHALVFQEGKGTVSTFPVWHPETDPLPFRLFMEKGGDSASKKETRFDRQTSDIKRPAAAVAARQTIPSGQTREFVFVLAWYMPHVIGNDGTDYGVYYTTRWKSIQNVLEEIKRQDKKNRAGMLDWNKKFQLQASFSGGLLDRMRNGMAILARDGVFCADGKFSFLTSNPERPGNLGSPEERLADVCFLLQCFPELLRSELELMTGAQLADGEVPSAWGNLYQVIGNGNIPGGFIGNPDSTAAYVLLIYQYYLWTGDREFLDDKYPHLRYALHWLIARDGNGDSVPDGSSLWSWGGENVTSLFSGSLALAAFRVGEELEQIYQDLEFQSWCRQHGQAILRSMNNQLWNGTYYNPYFDPAHPASSDSVKPIPGLLAGEWFCLQPGWNPLLPPSFMEKQVQMMAHQFHAPDGVSSPLAESAWRYGFAAAFTGPVLLRYGYTGAASAFQKFAPSGIEPGWWSFYSALTGSGMDLNRRCLFVGPVLPLDTNEFNAPFSTPLYSGMMRFSQSLLSGQQRCSLEFDNAPGGKEGALQQIAFHCPQNTDVNTVIMQVYHNGEIVSGQDFSRETLRVFGFQPALRLKKGDTLSMLLTSKEGPRVVVDVQAREIQNYGGKCRIEKISMPLSGVSFYMTNLLREQHLVSIELTNPAQKQEYTVFVNGEKRPYAIPSPEPVPLVLPLSPVSTNEIVLLQLTVKACQEAAVKLASVSGRDELKKKLWDLQEEVNRLVELDINQRGIRFDILPNAVAGQFKYPDVEESGESLLDDFKKLNELRRDYMETIQKQSGDPVLASELTGYFVPVDLRMSAQDIVSASESFWVDVRMDNPANSPVKGRITLDLPEGWRSVTGDDVVFDDREGTAGDRKFRFSISASNDLWFKRYAMQALLGGTWNGFPFRKTQAAYVGHNFIKQWMTVGPFSNERGEGFGKMNPPEINIQLKESYQGMGRDVSWSQHEFPDGYVDFDSVMTPNDNAAAYAYTGVYCPREQGVQFRIGCNSDLKLFLNYKEIYAKRNVGKLQPGGEIITHRLYEGWNHLAVKLSERVGPWGFYFEIYDLQGKPIEGMQFALDKLE